MIVASMYESGEYLKNNPQWHVEDSDWKAAHIGTLIDRLGLPHGNVCDIGCGVGEVIRRLSERYPDSSFEGYDYAEAALELARSRETVNCKYVAGGIPQGKRFDIVMALDVLEHVEDCFSFLRALRGVAATKIFHIPLDMSALGIAMNRPIRERGNVGHLHYFSQETALATLKDCGYEIVHWEFTKGYLLYFRKHFLSGRMPREILKLLALGLPRLLLGAVAPVTASRLLGGYSLLVAAR